MNNYKKYLLEESGNHLYKMKSKDTNSLWSNQSLTVNSVYISDFFEFYLKDLKITPKELMESSDSSKFIEIFYNVNYQKFEQRKEWIKIFENVIVNDSNFFNESLKKTSSLLYSSSVYRSSSNCPFFIFIKNKAPRVLAGSSRSISK